MPAFEYRALNPTGREQRGVIEGDTARQARQVLRERGLNPLSITEIAERVTRGKGSRFSFGRNLSTAELALTLRQLATLVRSGTPLEESLATVARQNAKPRIKRGVLGVRARINEGHTLETALGAFPAAFPELYRATVAAGEQSGHLDVVLERLADYAENRQEMQSRINMALFYPAILTVIAFSVAAGLLTYVVPKVVQVFLHVGQELPFLTRALIAVSDAAKAYGLFVVLGLGLGMFLFSRGLRNVVFRTRVHHVLLHLPLLSRVVRGLNTARFARTLSILVASSVPVLDALRIAAQVVRLVPMQQAVVNAAAEVREGTSINTALGKSGYFPPITLHLIASGEASGNLEAMLERAATHQERELQSTLSTLLTLFEPILILVMGLMVLIIVLAILLPIFELNQLVR